MTFSQKSLSSSLASLHAMGNRIVNFPFFQPHRYEQQQNPDETVVVAAAPNVRFPPPPPSSIGSFFTTTKRDPGGVGFIDDVGGSVDGLMSCTESLGFESCDERRVDDQIGSLDAIEELCMRNKSNSKLKAKNKKREIKEFPPPLSSLSQDGKPIYFLRPVRVDGRLKLTEVKISRLEILRACRQDGRLRLRLIQDYDEDEYLEGENKEKEEEDLEESDKANEKNDNEGMQLEAIQEVIGNEWEDGRADGRLLSPRGGGGGSSGDGFRRCYEEVNHHQHIHHHRRHHGQHQHDMHVWRQHCVTIS